MEALPWAFAIVAAVGANYVAAFQHNSSIGRLVLGGTILPALALAGLAAARLLYALMNAGEVNARFAAGDLTYFGADIAFAVSLVLAALWAALAYVGFRVGRIRRARSSSHS